MAKKIIAVSSAARSIESSRALNPQLQTFDDWLNANPARIPLA